MQLITGQLTKAGPQDTPFFIIFGIEEDWLSCRKNAFIDLGFSLKVMHGYTEMARAAAVAKQHYYYYKELSQGSEHTNPRYACFHP